MDAEIKQTKWKMAVEKFTGWVMLATGLGSILAASIIFVGNHDAGYIHYMFIIPIFCFIYSYRCFKRFKGYKNQLHSLQSENKT